MASSASSIRRLPVWAIVVASGVLWAPIHAEQSSAARDRQTGDQSQVASPAPIMPVEGPSTLHHLGTTIEESSMGWAGEWSPPLVSDQSPAEARLRSEPAGGPFVLTGADLYRLSCRACHKADGTGAPPEIHSLIDPVRSASVQWMTADIRSRGQEVDEKSIRQLTIANEAKLRLRLKQGGHNMPSFGQISDQEYAVLRPYLDQIAGVPNARSGRRTIPEQVDRVGELVVKGTCHICHDATQTREAPTTVLSGMIPSLASFPSAKSGSEFVHKVTAGAQVPLGAGSVMSRGRMPVFAYLTKEEIAAAYSYLMTYRPR